MLAPAYLGLLIFILFFEVIRKKSNKIDFLTVFNIIFLLLYPMPAFFLEADFDNSTAKMMFNGVTYKSNIQTAIAIFIGYFIVILGFYSNSAKKIAKKIKIQSSNNKIVIGYTIILLLLSSLSICIYSLQYGSLLDALSKTILIRSNAVDSGNLVFVKHFIFTSFFASYILASFAFKGKNSQRRLFLDSIFLLSVFLSLFGSILLAGRTNIAYYMGCFYFTSVIQGKRISWFIIIPALWFICLFVLYGKAFFFSLSGLPDGFDAVVEKFVEATEDPAAKSNFDFYDFINNFSYPIHSLDAALNKEYEWRLFIDWWYGLISLLPEKVFHIQKPVQVNENNTFYILGTANFDIPPGLLAYSIYTMSWTGLIIVCYIYGWLGRYLQTIIYKHMDRISWMPFIYGATAQVWVDFLVSGSPEVYMQTNIWYVTSIVLLLSIVVKVSINPHSRIHQNI